MNWNIDTPSKQFSTLAVLAIVWGSSFILMKRGLEFYSSIQVAEYRLFVAGISLLPIALRHLNKFPKKRKQQLGILFVALFGNFFPAFLFAEAQTKLPSGVTGMLNSLVPLFALIIGLIVFRTKSGINQFLGVALGLVGAITLIYFTSNGELGNIPFSYSLMVVSATVCYAISVNTIKAWLHEVPSVLITAFAFVFLGPFVTVGLFVEDFWSLPFSSTAHMGALGYLTILGVVGTGAAVLLFNQLIKFTSALFASSVTYLIPIVALAWGILDGESISLFQLAGLLLILGGVYLVSVRKTS
ncbi:MAG: EamA family transporter [Crocinitomicaceae bacterium]|nr:EamA family transporter [Crocinitomicaceae bacterium]|tara:strand:+ start:15428 stop:16327 length:900 start_codon:yes stop_codon:yes gene_type:complete